jgi:hypothetical protein
MQAPPGDKLESYALSVLAMEILLMVCALGAAEIAILHLWVHHFGWADVSLVSATLASVLLARLA